MPIRMRSLTTAPALIQSGRSALITRRAEHILRFLPLALSNVVCTVHFAVCPMIYALYFMNFLSIYAMPSLRRQWLPVIVSEDALPPLTGCDVCLCLWVGCFACLSVPSSVCTLCVPIFVSYGLCVIHFCIFTFFIFIHSFRCGATSVVCLEPEHWDPNH